MELNSLNLKPRTSPLKQRGDNEILEGHVLSAYLFYDIAKHLPRVLVPNIVYNSNYLPWYYRE